jgi:hypothetical protein
VRVRVVDGADQPVTSGFVRLREGEFPRRTFEGSADAANQGVLTFDQVFEGPVSAEVSDVFARGGRAASVLPGPGATVEIKVRLTVTGTVRGHLFMPDGTTPIPFAEVRLLTGGRVVGRATTAGTGDVGAFEFAYVPAGPVRLEAQDPLTARMGIAASTLESEGQQLVLDVHYVNETDHVVTGGAAVELPLSGSDVRVRSR